MSGDSGSSSDSVKSQVNTRPRRRLKMAEPVAHANATLQAQQNISHDVKIPPFWPEKPAIWFAQVEAQFVIRGISDDVTKFYHVLSNLDRQCADEIEDILREPPDYDRLKSELIKRMSVSRENKVNQLLMHEELGTRKPSQFLRHLQHLAGPKIPDDFMKTMWISRLPSAMQPIVASQPTLSLSEISELADRVHDMMRPSHHVAAMASTSSSSTFDELNRKVDNLANQVSALTDIVSQRSRPRERSTTRRRDRSSSRRSDSNYRRFPICWYHYKFGTQAKEMH
ncbi:uncharacterized protein [Epargyreus clarus]|uniref:uncharacterized protein n=1 Tax=Epargyreus clarus TaxID=520877 RepID=UPI003C2B8AE1